MQNLSTTIATYGEDQAAAETDWVAVETAASTSSINLADAALVKRTPDGTIDTIRRQSHHGWGKGAIAGAVVGVLFPPAIIAGAVAGAAGGGLIAWANRSLDRAAINHLGEVMTPGEIALVVLTHRESVETLTGLLAGASRTITQDSSTAEEVQEALNAETSGPS
jgi:uncharacterized membrane protein